MLLKDSPIGRFVVQLPTQYTTLNLGIVLSALMQGAAVLLASSHGVNVNWDGALWGPLYGTAFLSLVYGIAAARSYDWGSLCRDLIGMLGAVVGVLAGAFNTLVFKQEWLFAGRR